MSTTIMSHTKPRRRDRLRAFLSPSSTPVPPPLNGQQACLPTSSSGSGPIPSNTSVQLTTAVSQQAQPAHLASSNLLERALQQLPERERAIIESCVGQSSTDIDAAVRQTLNAAHVQQKVWSEKRWRVTLGSKEIVLRDEADKVADWIEKLVPLGDAAAGIDPIHAGLPWAGLKLLLQASTLDSKQMAAVLSGCETALYVADRLKVYVQYAGELAPCQARENLEMTLVEFYKALLEFLARAIQVYQTSTLRRIVTAIWTVEDLSEFTDRCDTLRSRAHEDATACNLAMTAQDRRTNETFGNNLQKLLNELRQWRDVQRSVRKLEIKMDLNRLPYADGAMFGSFGESFGDCHPGTRVDLLDEIKSWATNIDTPTIFWLHGKAGVGKSTICRTVARWLESQQLLSASFFFKRGGGDRETARRFCPTVLRQLIQEIPELASPVAQVIDHDPLIFEKLIEEQFDKLIHKPLCQIQASISNKAMHVVVIDALDECSDDKDIRTILKWWCRLADAASHRLKLFVTSRPEISVSKDFDVLAEDTYRIFDLHQIADAVYNRDLVTFFTDEFAEIRAEFNKQTTDQHLSNDWPSDSDLQTLLSLSHPLFIFAATALRFVKNHYDPEHQLRVLLTNRRLSSMSQINHLYNSIMEQAVTTTINTREDKEIALQEFGNVVGSIVSLAEPLSKSVLSELLQMPQTAITFYLRPLHSVLVVPTQSAIPIRPFHLSFVEHILDTKHSYLGFSIVEKSMHKMLFEKCIELLSRPEGLRENICQVSRLNNEQRHLMEKTTVDNYLTPAIQYACRFWTHHLQRSENILDVDDGPLLPFLTLHALHWIEAMAWVDRLAEAADTVQSLATWLALTQNAPKSLILLQEMHQLVFKNRYIIDLEPLQLYSSAIVFTPECGELRKLCGQIPDWVQVAPRVPSRRISDHVKLEIVDEGVLSSIFSHDGRLLAAKHFTGNVILWDVLTGHRLRSLNGWEYPWTDIEAMAFSADDTELVVLFADGVVLSWDVSTGQTRPMEFSTPPRCRGVTISSDASTIVVPREPSVLEIKKTNDSHVSVISPEGYDKNRPVTINHDGGLLALECSNASPPYIGIWSTSSLTEQLRLMTPFTGTCQMRFSHSSRLLAVNTSQSEIIVWDTITGDKLKWFSDPDLTLYPGTLAFSHDDRLLVVTCYDEPLLMFDMDDCNGPKKLMSYGPDLHHSVFSPVDKHMVASSSYDGMIRLWDALAATPDITTEPDPLKKVMLVPQDTYKLVTASTSGTVALWDLKGYLCNNEPLVQLQHFNVHAKHVMAFGFSPSGTSLITATANRRNLWPDGTTMLVTIRFWDLNTGTETSEAFQCKITKFWEIPRWVGFSSTIDGLVITASDWGVVSSWDAKTGQQLNSVQLQYYRKEDDDDNYSEGDNYDDDHDDDDDRFDDNDEEVEKEEDKERKKEEAKRFPSWKRIELSPYESHKLAVLFKRSNTVCQFDIRTGECLGQNRSPDTIKALEWGSEGPEYALTIHRTRDCKLKLDSNWISKGHKLGLWIPPEYRSNANIIDENTGLVILCPKSSGFAPLKIDTSSNLI